MTRGKRKFSLGFILERLKNLGRRLNRWLATDITEQLPEQEQFRRQLDEVNRNWAGVEAQIMRSVDAMTVAVMLYVAEYQLSQGNYEQAVLKFNELRATKAFEAQCQTDPVMWERVLTRASQAWWSYFWLVTKTR